MIQKTKNKGVLTEGEECPFYVYARAGKTAAERHFCPVCSGNFQKRRE